MNKRRIQLNLVLCAMMHGFNHYLMIFFKPMYPLMADYFGLDMVSDITTKLVAAYFGYGLSNLLTGFLARKFSLKMLLFFGMMLMSIATIAFAFIPANRYNPMAILCVFFIGLGGGTYHPAANTLMTRLYESKQGHAIGILSIGSAAGFVAAPIVGTYIGRDWLGFQTLFLISGSLVLLFNLVFLFLVKDAPPVGKEEPAAGIKKVKPLPLKIIVVVILLLCIPSMLRDLMSWGYFEITPFWAEYRFSSAIGIGIIQLMAYLPGPVVQPIAGMLCDKLGPMRVLLVTFLMCTIGHAMLAVISPIFAWTGMVLYGVGMSASTVASETYMASIVSVKNRTLVYGVVLSVALGVGGVLGGTSGWLVDAFGKTNASGYQIWFAGMGALMAASAILYPVIQRIRKRVV